MTKEEYINWCVGETRKKLGDVGQITPIQTFPFPGEMSCRLKITVTVECGSSFDYAQNSDNENRLIVREVAENMGITARLGLIKELAKLNPTFRELA